MFWKKGDRSTVTFTYEDPVGCQRQTFRVHPADDQPIDLVFMGKKTKVLNISAGGMAFENQNFSAGDSEELSMTLPGENRLFSCVVTVLRMDDSNKICFSKFTDVDADSADVLHHYVLARQKQVLRG